MRGVFRVAPTISGVLAAKTLVYITAPTTAVLEILAARITSQDEATSEQLYAELNRISSLGIPTATAITPKPSEEGSAASAASAYYDVTANEPVYDTADNALYVGGANKLAGWEYVPLPEERDIIKPGDSFGLRLLANLANATNLTAEIRWREIG